MNYGDMMNCEPVSKTMMAQGKVSLIYIYIYKYIYTDIAPIKSAATGMFVQSLFSQAALKFPIYCPLVKYIHLWSVDSRHKG